jgi:hypothetical protein
MNGALMAAVLGLMLRRQRLQREARLLADGFGSEPILNASMECRAVWTEGPGVRACRGSGVLMLTKRELYFRRYARKAQVRVLLASVEEVQALSARRPERARLLLRYRNQIGDRITLMWRLSRAPEWAMAIRTAAAHQQEHHAARLLRHRRRRTPAASSRRYS